MSRGEYQSWKETMIKLSGASPDDKPSGFNNPTYQASLAQWKELVS